MRATLPLFRRCLAVSAAAVLLTACSGDESGDAGGDDSATSPTTSSGPAPTSDGEVEAPEVEPVFCSQSQDLLEGLGAVFTDQTDPAAVEGAFQEAAEGFRTIEPPPEIEGDWTALGDGLEEYASAFAELDETDPQSVADFQQRTSALQGELTTAASNVESYLNEECGIGTGQESTETSAPTS